jgi:hypothetical protein
MWHIHHNSAFHTQARDRCFSAGSVRCVESQEHRLSCGIRSFLADSVAERFIRELYGTASASEKSAELTLFHGFDVFSGH